MLGGHLKRWKRRHNTTHAKIRCLGEQAVATLKGCRPDRRGTPRPARVARPPRSDPVHAAAPSVSGSSTRAGPVAEVAGLMECHPVTVRAAVHRFEEGGVAGLPDVLRPGRPRRLLGTEDRAALGALLDDPAQAGITWTVPALCEWLRVERGVEISSGWLGEWLRREGFRWKRTRVSVRNNADPDLQQAARA
ncbi:helix-turn-helix domain-containing protein [Streptomyces xanthophaeus]